jgi:hypothetical protein
MKPDREVLLMMLHVHALQCNLWAKDVKEQMHIKYEYKSRVNDVINATNALLRFHRTIMSDDDYETSAEVSDSLYAMAKLPNERIKELTNQMEEFINENSNNQTH